MKIGICDDNRTYLEYLHKKVIQFLPENKNITVTNLSPDRLSKEISRLSCPYDILITDIDLGEFNGIDLVKSINEINSSCIIIFISNYLNYATKVYDVDHIYFVLKSEADSRLLKALEKAFSVYYEKLNDYLTISYQNTEYRIAYQDITYIEAFGRYLYIHTAQNIYKWIHSLKNINTKLSADFIQCHKSYLINLNHVHSLSRTNCILNDGSNITISYTYTKEFHDAYVRFISSKMNGK